jgi:hypothetical protein
MNCKLCGEICNCPPETQSAFVPRWTHDEADCVALEPAPVRAGNELSSSVKLNVEETPAAANESAAAESISQSVEDIANETSAWRDELATRLNHYRARRKAPPPRYPSLRLMFDPPALRAGNVEAGASANTFGQVSRDALALDAFNSPNSDFDEAGIATDLAALPVSIDPFSPESRPQPAAPPLGLQNASQNSRQNGRTSTKIIEFPRLTSPGPPIQLDELAGPAPGRPRILEVPEFVPPPPALGGITIESEQPQAIEKLPGIDIPLQSAPLIRRMVAGVLDVLVVAAASALAGFIFWKVAGVRPPRFQFLALAIAVPCLLWATYQFLLIVYASRTPGLRLAKLELTGFNGTPTNRGVRRWRVLASYLSALSLGMGYAWVFLDEDCLCWHDRITHTYLAPKQSEALSPQKTESRS